MISDFCLSPTGFLLHRAQSFSRATSKGHISPKRGNKWQSGGEPRHGDRIGERGLTRSTDVWRWSETKVLMLTRLVVGHADPSA